ncbi:MAG: hypothetical protein A4E48_00068 [Methanosaeta sp. PtaU1.Bin060]|nr:MAG: hypothetical protein A4E48_00068 [Methanosaeta sp. PtaU1.Bin060]
MPAQTPRDRILWVLSENDGRMEISRLRRLTNIRNVVLYPLLHELAREGRIMIDGDVIAMRKR